jgi:hypothetical protein
LPRAASAVMNRQTSSDTSSPRRNASRRAARATASARLTSLALCSSTWPAGPRAVKEWEQGRASASGLSPGGWSSSSLFGLHSRARQAAVTLVQPRQPGILRVIGEASSGARNTRRGRYCPCFFASLFRPLCARYASIARRICSATGAPVCSSMALSARSCSGSNMTGNRCLGDIAQVCASMTLVSTRGFPRYPGASGGV